MYLRCKEKEKEIEKKLKTESDDDVKNVYPEWVVVVVFFCFASSIERPYSRT